MKHDKTRQCKASLGLQCYLCYTKIGYAGKSKALLCYTRIDWCELDTRMFGKGLKLGMAGHWPVLSAAG